jgi:chemotaxis protein methyltransferase CheR
MVARPRTNTTTHFFREERALEMIRDQKARRVWCVGCSTGDEAYSLAMLCLEAAAPVEITATDVNVEALHVAKRAEYPFRNLRHVEPERKARWFKGLQVVDALRNCVRFAHHDIITDVAPAGGFDVILCRHVMVYFTPQEIQRALATIIPALRPGGLLVLAASEWLGTELRAQTPECSWLELTEVGGVIAYQRISPPRTLVQEARVIPVQPVATPALPPKRPPTAPRAELAADRLRREGDTLLDRGAVGLALFQYELALREDSLRPELYLRSALCQLHLGVPDRAREELRRCLFLDPELWPAWIMLGDLLEHVDPERSRGCFERAITLLEGPSPVCEGAFFGSPRVALEATRRHLRSLQEGNATP